MGLAARTRVVLVNPQGSANLGAVARSMTTFGLDRLVLVSPHAPLNRTARNWACHGAPVLQRADSVETLETALRGATLCLGLTRRQGKRRHRLSTLAHFAEQELEGFLPAEVALVFGNEESGLANEHLDLCHRLVRIPTHPTQGSMNLGHAVTATLYELFGRGSGPAGGAARLARPELRSRMLAEMADYLGSLGYPAHDATLEEEMTKLGDIAARARLEEWEVRFLMGMLKQVRRAWGSARAVGREEWAAGSSSEAEQ